jgi:RNA recognition motif. (a.k.a. RRM, RBD, or RNP domain)
MVVVSLFLDAGFAIVMLEFTNSTGDYISHKSSMQGDTTCSSQPDIDSPYPISTFVGGIPRRCSEDQLTQFMSQFGYVKEVYISKDEKNGGHKGFAFVNFSSVNRMDYLFGNHLWLGKKIEIKRSLQEYINLINVPEEATQGDIISAFTLLGYRALEVIMGGRVPGVLKGHVGVRLMKFSFQEKVAKLGTLMILGKKVKMMLHRPTDRKIFSAWTRIPKSTKARQRSKIDQEIFFAESDSWQTPTRHDSMCLNSDELPVQDEKHRRLCASTSGLTERFEALDSPSQFADHRNVKSSMTDVVGSATYEKGHLPKLKNENYLSSVQKLKLAEESVSIPKEMNQYDCFLKLDPVFIYPTIGTFTLEHNFGKQFAISEVPRREVLIAFYAFPGHL